MKLLEEKEFKILSPWVIIYSNRSAKRSTHQWTWESVVNFMGNFNIHILYFLLHYLAFFLYCICLFTLLLSSYIHLDKTSCIQPTSSAKFPTQAVLRAKDWGDNWLSQPLPEVIAHGGGQEPSLLVLCPFCCGISDWRHNAAQQLMTAI